MYKYKQTLYLAAYTYVVGLAYLLIIQLNVVDMGLVNWDSDAGVFLSIPFLVCMAYATFMLIYAQWHHISSVDHVNSHVYYMDKHESIARVMENE